MLKLKSLKETYGKKVYTENGDFFGEIQEAFIKNNKVASWKIRATQDSLLSTLMSGVKGVIVPQALFTAIGDIVIISNQAMPMDTIKE